MYKILLALTVLVAVARGQYNRDPQTAQILNEQRYLGIDGKFGAQYTQEDGVEFKEESDADGTRHGSYSYVDPSGQRRTVTYTAGKNGFQATGDHLPQAPAAPLPVAPQPQYTPLPQYNSPQQYQQPQYQQPQYQQPQYQQPKYQQPQYQQPQYQQPKFQQPQYQGVQYQQYTQPQYVQPQPQPQPQYRPQAVVTTPAPHRFFPPGKLNLNRSPEGYSFSFQKS